MPRVPSPCTRGAAPSWLPWARPGLVHQLGVISFLFEQSAQLEAGTRLALPFVYTIFLPVPSPVSSQTCRTGTGYFLAHFGFGHTRDPSLTASLRCASAPTRSICSEPSLAVRVTILRCRLSRAFGGGKADLCPDGKRGSPVPRPRWQLHGPMPAVLC